MNPPFEKLAEYLRALAEYSRQRPGTLRSIHHTHSVCGVGAQARELLNGHEAAAMWPAVHEKLKEDPLFFVDREEEKNEN